MISRKHLHSGNRKGRIVFNWEAIGAVGEIGGAVAVVLTLFYLAKQIRQNTNSLTGTTLNTLTQHQQHELKWSAEIGESYLKALNASDTLTAGSVAAW